MLCVTALGELEKKSEVGCFRRLFAGAALFRGERTWLQVLLDAHLMQAAIFMAAELCIRGCRCRTTRT